MRSTERRARAGRLRRRGVVATVIVLFGSLLWLTVVRALRPKARYP